MSKKSKPLSTEPKPGRDLAAFERLPEETKELMKLKDQQDKTIGPDQVSTTRKIQEKARRKGH